MNETLTQADTPEIADESVQITNSQHQIDLHMSICTSLSCQYGGITTDTVVHRAELAATTLPHTLHHTAGSSLDGALFGRD